MWQGGGFCFFVVKYVEFEYCGYRIMAIITAFQAVDTGSTPVTRLQILLKISREIWGFSFAEFSTFAVLIIFNILILPKDYLFIPQQKLLLPVMENRTH